MVEGQGQGQGEGAPAPGHVVSSALVLCEVGSAEPGPGEVEVGVGEAVLSTVGVAVQFTPQARALAVSPAEGSEEGTVVMVAGEGLGASKDVSCRMGTVGPVEGRWSGAKGVECVTVAHGAGEVPVGVDHASMEEAASFTYLEAPVVQAVEPAMGLTSGGALLKVFREGTGAQLECQLGHGRSVAVAAAGPAGAASGYVECPQPAGAPGFVEVLLGSSTREHGAVVFQYVGPSRLDSVSHGVVASGGVGGVVHVAGAHIPAGAHCVVEGQGQG